MYLKSFISLPIILALKNKNLATLNEGFDNYKRTHTEVDMTIRTFRKNRSYLKIV